jgi:tetratricopeptide (TPR) repeat protein
MTDNQRIDDLRRRIHEDPASIAFAQLAEELRRANVLEEAVACCRAGLERHPSYLSARVTLGRALLALGRLEDAEVELRTVIAAAPDNLSTLRALGEIYQQWGRLDDAHAHFQKALTIARNDPDLQEAVAGLSQKLGPRPAAPPAASHADRRDSAPDPLASPRLPRVREQRTIEALEQWLDAINVSRTDSRA